MRKFVRQLKSIDESYIPPLEKVQILSESSGAASTLFEGVIAACHNLSNLRESDFKKQILKDQYVSSFLPAADKLKGKSAFATSGKSQTEKLDILWNFSKICKQKLTGKSDAGAGQKKMKISKEWQRLTTKGVDTSKADILVGSYRTSVKGPAAQLMSGEKKETRATVLAAIEVSGASSKLKEELLAEVDKFVTNTRTIGAEVNSRVLKKMSVDAAVATNNKEAKRIIDLQESLKRDITKKFNEAFNDPELGKAFAFESMTGYEKFGGKAFNKGSGDTKGEATHMLIWDYRMDRLKFLPIDMRFAAETAKKMVVKPDLKSNSYAQDGVKAGYNFYQALRVSVEVLLNKQGELENTVKEEIQKSEKLLSEGNLTEINFKELIGKAWEMFKSKVLALWNWFSSRISAIYDFAVRLIKDSVDKALAVFQLDIDVKVNPVVNFRI